MKFKNIIFFIITISFAMSCDEIELKKADTNIAVVESYLMPGNKISVKIVKQLVFESESAETEYLDNLSVRISDGNTWTELTFQDTSYTAEIEIESEINYYLEFEYNGYLVNSETYIPSKPISFTASESTIEVISFDNFNPGSMSEMQDPIDLTWTNESDDYYMVVIECLEDSLALINEDTDRPQRSFRSAPTQNISEELNPMSFMYFGSHQIILYKLNPEYAALYEQLGTSSLDIVAPPTNIENGLGIFTGMNSDTLYVNVVSQ